MVSSSFATLLDKLYFTAPSEKEKGSRFERLMQSYLQTEPK